MKKPKIAVWKFSSCDGCQLSLLNCEDELLTLLGEIDLAYFLEATRAVKKGPYDLSIIEGSITTPHDQKRIQEVRSQSKKVMTIGACATSGGIQALRNFQDVKEFTQVVYARPEFIQTLEHSTAISDHISVDLELRGCPIQKEQLLEAISALLIGRRPVLPSTSVCMECKLKGNPCLLVSHGTACLGPITQAGCQALCPSFNRGCFGCFGPNESANPVEMSKILKNQGMSSEDLVRIYRTFNANAPVFREESKKHELK